MMDYMRWAKLHDRVRYDLTPSGVPDLTAATLAELGVAVTLDPGGPYGDPDLIAAIADRYGVAPDQVVLVPGASAASVVALAAVMGHDPERGAAVLLERPLYEPIDRARQLLGLRAMPVRRSASTMFDVRAGDVDTGLRDGARAVVLTNPHNPSGRYLPRSVMSDIARRCADHGAALIVDEVYLDAVHLVRGVRPWTAARLGDHVIATNSLTKVYGCGGLRIGWIITGAATADRARSVMDALSVNNAAPSMALANAVFAQIHEFERRYTEYYRQREPVLRRWLDDEPLVHGYPMYGVPFAWVHLPAGVSSVALNDRLRDAYDTQVVPGRFFGRDDHVRIGLASPPADLRAGLMCISRALRDAEPSGHRTHHVRSPNT